MSLLISTQLLTITNATARIQHFQLMKVNNVSFVTMPLLAVAFVKTQSTVLNAIKMGILN